MPQINTKNNQSIVSSFYILFTKLSSGRKRQLAQLFFMMLIGGAAEVVSIGMVIPFLSILLNPQQAADIPFISWLMSVLNFDDNINFYWKLTLLFSILIVSASVARFFLSLITAKFNFGMGHELGLTIYKSALYQSYGDYVNRNSSEIIGSLNKLEQLIWVIFGMLNTVSALVMLTFIVVALVLIAPTLSILILFGLGGVYIFFLLVSRRKLDANSQIIAKSTNKRMQVVQEGLGAMRDILLNHNQKMFTTSFNDVDWGMRRAQMSNNIISPIPRFVVESLGVILIAFFAYRSVTLDNNLVAMMPILGALALGLQRLIPLAQQAYLGWSQFNGNRQLLFDVTNIIAQPTNREDFGKAEPLSFRDKICIKNVSFNYKSSPQSALNGINLSISKGDRIGIIGATGSGKSTVVDLLMCLLEPSTGKIFIDGVALTKKNCNAWQKNIAHVPQDVYLLDTSFAENIAFDLSNEAIDIERVKCAAEKAQISDFIEASSHGYYTTVGERGMCLSGGQRQRIGIARALYKKACVLVFDEATSALDSDTEKSVISAMTALGKDITVITIAHRISTVKDSDCVYRLDQGCIVNQGKPEKVLSESQ